MIIEKSKFKDLFSSMEISVSDKQYDKLYKYAEILIEWNKMVNLTAILSPEDISQKHFLDSVLPFSLFNVKRGAKIIDVGTGAGFPSCPLKIFRDDIQITLLDSLNKRIRFLEALSDELSLNAECIHGRAEELAHKEDYREHFDIATARAVASLPMLCEYCLPFVKKGGYFIALKGGNSEDEIDDSKSAIKVLGGKIDRITDYSLPNGDKRVLIAIKKISQTASKYPRNKGQITKKPL